jgi:hypothetical protein
MAWKLYGYYIESFLGTYICWCFLAGMTESCNSPFLSCNCVCGLWHKQQMCHWDTEMMSERRRCHYYARGKTQHEEAFNVRHLCIQQCLTDFLLHWTTHNGSWKCALKNAANVHTETVLSARLGLVHGCLRPPYCKQEAKIQAQISQILGFKRESERETESSLQYAMIDQKKGLFSMLHLTIIIVCLCGAEARPSTRERRLVNYLSTVRMSSGRLQWCAIKDLESVQWTQTELRP